MLARKSTPQKDLHRLSFHQVFFSTSTQMLFTHTLK
jgi:hypothetical protein